MNSVPLEKLKLFSDDDFQKFTDIFREVSAAVMSSFEFTELPIDLKTYYEKFWLFSIPHGKKIRAEVLIVAFKFFTSDISKETIHLLYVLGWIQEILHSASMIGDGLKGKLKRGTSSWYIQDAAGVGVANDMIFIENAAYILTKKYFCDKPYYKDLMDFLRFTSFRNSFGRSLDLMSEKLRDLYTSPKYCMSLYNSMTEYRLTTSLFYAPVALAMIMAGVKRETSFLAVKDITSRIGAYYQTRQDFKDVITLPEQTGRIRTDFPNGNYTWPAMAAFERANDFQRKILMENYTRQDFPQVPEVKAIFEQLNISKWYLKYESESRMNINLEIKKSVEYPQALFQLIMAAVIDSSS